MQIDVARRVAAPSDRVWTVVTDLANSPRVMTAIESVEILDGPQEFGVGTRWRETRTMFGKRATEEMAVSAVDPGRSYTVVAHGQGARYQSTVAIVPEGEAACTLTMTFGGEPTSTASRIMAATVGRLFIGATRRALEADLADIACAAESSGA